MSNFSCHKCKAIFKRKHDLNRHLNRITNCVSGSKTNKKKNYYECNKCKQNFSRKDALTRHQKNNICKITIKNNNLAVSGNENTSLNGNNSTLIGKSKNSHISVNSNNTISNPIIIINFSKDGIDDLSAKELQDLLKCDHNLIEKLMTTINLNPDKPSHHNIFYADLKSAYGEVYRNKKWVKKKIDEILNILIDVKIEDLNQILSDCQHLLNDETRDYIKNTIADVHISRSKARKKLKSYLKPILYNNRKIILKTKQQVDKYNNKKYFFDDETSESLDSIEEESE